MEIEEGDTHFSWDKGFWHTKGDSQRALQGFADRMKDIVREEVGTDFPPIRGLSSIPLVSLQEAVEGLADLVSNIDSCFEQCQRYLGILKEFPDGIEEEDFQVLLLMTWPWEDLEGATSLYHLLNAKLRELNREELQPYLSLLKVFFSSLYRLPIYKGSVWAGIRSDITSTYKEGQRLTWSGFISLSPNIRNVIRPNFAGRHGQKTLINLKISKGFQVNLVPSAPEVVLPPGRQVRVKNIYDAGDGVKIVELEELVPDVVPFDFPEAVKEVGSEEFYLEQLQDALDRRNMNKYMQILKQLPMDKECYLYLSFLQTLSEFIGKGDYTFNHEDESFIARLILTIMVLQSDNISVQKLALSFRNTLSVFKDDSVATETINAIARMLRNNVEAADIQIDGHTALQAYLTKDRFRILAGNEGIIQSSILAIKTHAEELTIVERIYQTLSLLALSPMNSTKIGQSGIISSLFQFWKVNLENPVILEPVCLLSRLTSNNATQAQIGNDDRLGLILDTMKTHPSHAGILQYCCHTLSRLAQNESARDVIAIRGGIIIILTAMRTNSSNSTMLRNGCMALATLAKSVSNAYSICRENGIELILKVMSDHETSEGLQEAACTVLRTLWHYAPPTITEESVVGSIHKAMVLHFDHRGIQASACSALETIWENKNKDSDNELSEETVGTMEAILRAITCHHDHPPTQRNGFLALIRISNCAQAQNIIRNSGVEAAVSALNSQFKRPQVQETILLFLNELSQSSCCHKAITKQGGPDLVAKVMVKEPYNIQIQTHGSGILASLSKTAENSRMLSQSIVMQAMSTAKVQHPQNEDIQNNVNMFLKTQKKKQKERVKMK